MIFLLMFIVKFIHDNYGNNAIKLTDCNDQNHLFFNDSKYNIRTEIDKSMIYINNIYGVHIVRKYGTIHIDEYKKYYLNITNLNNETYDRIVYGDITKKILEGDIVCISDRNIIVECCSKRFYSVGYGSIIIVLRAIKIILFTILCCMLAIIVVAIGGYYNIQF